MMAKGSTPLKVHMLRRFFARGGGFISTKDESTLQELGILPATSRKAHRLAGEFAGRYLLKAMLVAKPLKNYTDLPRLQFSADASRVCGKEVLSVIKYLPPQTPTGKPIATCSAVQQLPDTAPSTAAPEQLMDNLVKCMDGKLPTASTADADRRKGMKKTAQHKESRTRPKG